MKTKDKGDKRNKEKRKEQERRKREPLAGLTEQDILEGKRGLYEVGKFYRLGRGLDGKPVRSRPFWTKLWPEGRVMGAVHALGSMFMFVQEVEVFNKRLKRPELWRKVIMGELIGWVKGGVLELVTLEEPSEADSLLGESETTHGNDDHPEGEPD